MALVMHREVCLKHRKNRREMNPAGASSSELAAVFVLFVVRGAGVTARAAFRGHRSRAGCLSANQGMPVQVRLTAPFFRNTQRVRRAPACAAESPKLRGLGAAPRRRATFQIAGEPGGKAAAS